MAAGLILSLRLLTGGYLFGHDMATHAFWAQQFLMSLSSGLLHPSWVMETNLGAGSPAFVFYPPFIFYTYPVFELFTHNVPYIMLYSAALALVWSGLAMYLYAGLFMDRPRAFVVSLIYMAAPYHLLDIYIRANMAEFWAFAWIPLVFYAAHRAATDPSTKRTAWLAAAFAGLVVTHILTAMLVAAFIIPYMLVFAGRAGRKTALLHAAAGLGAGLLLSGVYLIPAMMEQPYILVEGGKGPWYEVYNNFIFFQKFGDWWFNIFVDITSMAALGVAAIAFVRYFSKDKGSRESAGMRLIGFSAFAIAAGFLMMTPLSTPLWAVFAPLRKVAFPWRILSPMSLLASIALGLLLLPEFRPQAPGRRKAMLAAVAVVLVISAVLAGRIVIGYKGITPPPGFKYTPEMSYDEFRQNTMLFTPGDPAVLDDPYFMPAQTGGKLEIVNSVAKMEVEGGNGFCFFKSGEGEAEPIVWDPEHRIFKVHAVSKDTVVLRLYAYPDWNVLVNGLTATTHTERDGLLSVDVPEGDSIVELTFRGGIYGVIGLLSTLIAAAGIVWTLVRRPRKKNTPSET